MTNILFTLVAMLAGCMIGSNAAHSYSTSTLQSRSADTCADPSLAVTFIEAFNAADVAHALVDRPGFVSSGAGQGQWLVEGEVFLAWKTQQNFTTAFYRFFDETTADYLFTISTDDNPPSVPGFTQNGIVGYVYATQECGSVPLFGAWNQALGDHYYTTIANEHSELIGISGWVDAGIAAYVLPLSSDCSCSS